MNAAIIGAGAIAFGTASLKLPMTHVKSYAKLVDTVSLKAAVEPDEACRAAMAEAYSDLALYASIDALFSNETIDIVSVCAPDALHERILLELMAYPIKGVWCEKPLALSEAGFSRIAAATRGAEVVIQVNYWRRFVPEIRAVAQAVREGRYGKVHRVTGIYPETYRHNGCHLFDLLELFLGEYRPESIRLTAPLRADGDGMVTIVGEAGGVEVVCVGAPRKPYNIFELDLLCEAGRIRLTENGRRIEWHGFDQDQAFPHLELLKPLPEITSCNWEQAFDLGLTNLVESVRTNGTPQSGLRPSFRCARTLDAVESLIAQL